ncbi:MAG: thermonuclease family protein [Microbacterium sp.]
MHRVALTVLWLGLAAVLGFGIWFATGDDRARDTFGPAEPGATVADPAAPPPLVVPARPTDAFALTVDHVVDGDTIVARAVSPNAVVPTTDQLRIRLIGIDTPEGAPELECWANEAREHLRALLPEGATVWAAPDAEWRDRYDRALLYLWTEDGRFVNHELMAAGDGEVMTIAPNDTHADLFAAARDAASAGGVGRWGACG